MDESTGREGGGADESNNDRLDDEYSREEDTLFDLTLGKAVTRCFGIVFIVVGNKEQLNYFYFCLLDELHVTGLGVIRIRAYASLWRRAQLSISYLSPVGSLFDSTQTVFFLDWALSMRYKCSPGSHQSQAHTIGLLFHHMDEQIPLQIVTNTLRPI